MHSKKPTKESGFTLVELAIVLVIIGLIIGGVLVGQDLIKAAEVRATVSQIEKYNAAVNTFRTRFNGLPGDLRNASDYTGVLTVVAGAGGAGLGDGNRLLTSSGSASAISDATGETTLFWRHLSDANLVDGAYADDVVGGGTFATIGTSFPRAKIDRGGIGAYGVTGINYYQIGAQTTTSDLTNYGVTLTPDESNNIDVKVDDGRPLQGQVLARGGSLGVPNGTLTAAQSDGSATSCTTTAVATTALYSTAISGVNCQLRLRMN